MALLDLFRRAPPVTGEELCTVLLPDLRAEWSTFGRRRDPALIIELVKSPFQRDQLDTRFAPGTPLGAAHVRVLLAPAQRSIPERRSSIRSATALAREMVDAGALGVVVHGAGEVLFSAQEWARRTERQEEPAWTPTLAWIDLGNAEGVALSYGLRTFGLPEVGVTAAQLPFLSPDEAWHRSQEAILTAACAMVARGAPLSDGEMVRVIAGTELSGAPLQRDNLGLHEPAAQADTLANWRCELLDGLIRLVPPPLLPLSARFATLQSIGMMPYPPYRWLFMDRLRSQGYQKIAQLWPKQIPEVPAYEILVLRHERTGEFLTTTCGLGRVAQPGGTGDQRNQFIEFSVQLQEHSPAIAHSLGVLALMVHLKDPGSPPIGAGHRSQVPIPAIDFPYEWAVYDGLPDLDLGGPSPISRYQPIFMTGAERASVPVESITDWIHRHRTQALSRWLHPGSVVQVERPA
ncbi:MAG TPA: hypothetical protein VFA20_28190 [Myxococcaceae bacterium]|nr:hypothetical protein [Myxococcaceae bacterium]